MYVCSHNVKFYTYAAYNRTHYSTIDEPRDNQYDVSNRSRGVCTDVQYAAHTPLPFDALPSSTARISSSGTTPCHDCGNWFFNSSNSDVDGSLTFHFEAPHLKP